MAAIPYWKDKVVQLSTTESSVLFRIILEETATVIYTGRAYADASNITSVKVNDICYNWFRAVYPTISQSSWVNDFSIHPVSFEVDVWDGDEETWDGVAYVQFNNDWSYDDSFVPETMGLCFPINGRVDARMPIPFTAIGEDDDIEATIYHTNGTSETNGIGLIINASPAITDWNTDLKKALRIEGQNSVLFPITGYGQVAKVDIDGHIYKVVTDCAKYALYYVNAYGGWDALLIEGESLVSDVSDRSTSEMTFDNRVLSNRGTRVFANQLKRTYTLHTGMMNDDEASRMHHLLNSTEVYLRDIATGEMIPVVMETSQCDYKTYANQGGHLVRYDIVVSNARNLVRR